ncbi:hypothetical protein DF186_25170, partial [Enterococcus hirae]
GPAPHAAGGPERPRPTPMIGSRPRLGTGFAGLQQYLLHGRAGASPDRSVWVSTRNLPGEDPEQAAAIMRATAAESQR